MKKLFLLLSVLTASFVITACDVEVTETTPTDVIEAIDALPALDALTLNDEADVVAARSLYNELSMTDQALITNIDLLEVLETKLTELKDGPGTLVEEAVDAGFATLAAALTEAELVSALSGSDDYTVFAPTDAAFDALIAALETDASGLLAREDLTDILLYHVVDGQVLEAALTELITDGFGTAEVPTLLTGKSLTFTIDGSDVKINGTVTIDRTDIVALNGVIHVIDGVLLPPADPASFTVSFTGFEGADLGSVTYTEGDTLSFPTAPEIGGYTFDGWDNDGTSITSDVIISATYSKIYFTLTELSAFDGRNGADAYIAVNGVVYDVTGNPYWPNGAHNGNQAGQDLTVALSSSPHGIANVLRQPVVGFLSED